MAAMSRPLWPLRRWVVAAFGALVTFFALGLPAAVVASPWFGRATEPEWWSGPVLGLTAVLCGLLLATYVSRGRSEPLPSSATGAHRVAGFGAAIGFFAIGCPVCNKLVVLALGMTGALNWFQPVQPLLAIASVALVGWALLRRLDGERACPRATPP